jgi:hypothetical protein
MADDLDLDWLQAELRQELGLRPETRLDEIIYPDGAVLQLQSDGTFKQVR